MPLEHLKELQVRINWEANTPPYAQVVDQIYCMIVAVQLRPGDLLPQIRNLAAQLDANPNTIARAYNELESAGLIRKRQGSGCFVADFNTGRRSAAEGMKVLVGRVEELVSDAQRLGVSVEDLIAELRRHGPGPKTRLREKKPLNPKNPPSSPVSEASEPLLPNLWQPADTLID